MQYSIFGEQIAINEISKILGSVFSISGTDLSKVGLPNNFYFQMPGNFALAKVENINPYGMLVNTISESQEMYILSKFLGKCIFNGKLTDQFAEPYL